MGCCACDVEAVAAEGVPLLSSRGRVRNRAEGTFLAWATSCQYPFSLFDIFIIFGFGLILECPSPSLGLHKRLTRKAAGCGLISECPSPSLSQTKVEPTRQQAWFYVRVSFS